jgi:hypothetical protein
MAEDLGASAAIGRSSPSQQPLQQKERERGWLTGWLAGSSLARSLPPFFLSFFPSSLAPSLPSSLPSFLLPACLPLVAAGHVSTAMSEPAIAAEAREARERVEKTAGAGGHTKALGLRRRLGRVVAKWWPAPWPWAPLIQGERRWEGTPGNRVGNRTRTAWERRGAWGTRREREERAEMGGTVGTGTRWRVGSGAPLLK